MKISTKEQIVIKVYKQNNCRVSKPDLLYLCHSEQLTHTGSQKICHSELYKTNKRGTSFVSLYASAQPLAVSGSSNFRSLCIVSGSINLFSTLTRISKTRNKLIPLFPYSLIYFYTTIPLWILCKRH